MEIEQLKKEIQDQMEQIRQLMAQNSLLIKQLQEQVQRGKEQERQIQPSPVLGEQLSSASMTVEQRLVLREQITRIQTATAEQPHWSPQQQQNRCRGDRVHRGQAGYRRRQNRRHFPYWSNRGGHGAIYIFYN